MHHQSLCDAAISVSAILTAHHIRHAFFGGFAILEKCGTAYRESKDIDCLVSGDKEDVIQIFQGRPEWMVIPQAREDYVAFFWRNPSPRSNERELVLVELFVGVKHSHVPRSKSHPVYSPSLGAASIPILSEEFLFRGKLNACATRSKSSDVADVLFLIATFPRQVRVGGKKIDKKVVAMALGRYPHLRIVLQRVGVPVKSKLISSIGCVETPTKKIGEGDVHRGLGCVW